MTAEAPSELHRLHLVVCHVHRRHAELRVQAREIGAHANTQLRVQIRKRLVHQIDLRPARDRATHRNALSLSAGESCGQPVEQLVKTEQLGHLVDAPLDLVLRRLADCAGRS